MSRTCLLTLAALMIFSTMAIPANADMVTITASRDNTLFEDNTGSLSNGSGQHLFAGRTFQGSNDLRRGLIFFDLSSIPAGSTITNVSLSMQLTRTRPGSSNVSLHRLTADWGEAGSDAAGQEGTGAAAQAGDATWIHTFSPGSTWSSAGGDFVGGASATTLVGGLGGYNWTSAQMTADVQSWLDGGSSNFGWIVIGDESTAGSAKRFASRENGTAANRPMLMIEFTPIPEPGSAMAIGVFAGVALLIRRRRK